jgi:carbon-monoxide dehydrogenase large subunit
MSTRPRYVGQPLRRTEDPRLLRGQGRYVDDLRLPGTLHVAVVRSPHAHARLLGIDTARAAGVPGVRGVVTAADLDGVAVMRSDTLDAETCRATAWPVLARDRVHYAGEAVAAVLADDRYAAEDGAALVDVAYDPLPAVVDMDAALRAEAPRVHEGWPDNVLMHARGGGGDVAAAFTSAAVVVTGSFGSEAVTGVPLEARACLAALDEGSGVLTLWSSHQLPHVLRSLVAEHLGHPEHLLRVICPDMGGGFGIKTHLYPEDLVVAWLALRQRRPVKWAQTRREDFLASNYCREHRIAVEVAADAGGRLLGLRARILVNAGAYAILPGFGSLLEATGAARQLPGPYRLPAYEYEATSVVSHKVPRGAYRGVAMVTTTFTMERVMDLLAARTGLDPAEVRRRNLIGAAEFPYRNALGVTYEGASFQESLAAGLEAVGHDAVRAEQARARAAGRRLGLGIAVYAEFTAPSARALAWRGIVRVPGFDAVALRMDPAGKVRAYTSVTAVGQGIQTALAQLIADELGLDLADVRVETGDSTLAPYGSGTFASRGAVVGGGAAILAARRVREKIVAIAAAGLEAPPGDLVLAEGQVSVKGSPFRSLAITEVARRAYMVSPTALPDGIEPGLDATIYHDPPIQTISNGAHLAVVEVDPETGQVHLRRLVVVHDCGTVVNPLIVDGQIHGGVAQGIGQALAEAAQHDGAGQVLTASLMDYALPRADTMPAAFDLVHLETPSRLTVAGLKGMGEGGTIGVVAAIANAVADALGPSGAVVDRLPLSASRVRALAREGAGTG